MNGFSRPKYINWIIKEDGVLFKDGIPLSCYKIEYDITNEDVLNEWAEHIRKHYILDKDLESSIKTLHQTKKEHLENYIIPQKNHSMGPQTISGEFAEILIYDFIEHILDYFSLRGRHWGKSTPEQSVTGSDVLGIKMNDEPSENDELIIVEVKAKLSSCDYSVLENAKKDSDKDSFRHSLSLNYLRLKYESKGYNDLAKKVARFQEPTSHKYKTIYGASGITSIENLKDNRINEINGKDLNIQINNMIFFLHGKDLMNLAYDLYGRIIK